MVQLWALLAIMKDFFWELSGYVVLIAEHSPRSWRGLFVFLSLLLLMKTTAAGSISLKTVLSSFSFAGDFLGSGWKGFSPTAGEQSIYRVVFLGRFRGMFWFYTTSEFSRT